MQGRTPMRGNSEVEIMLEQAEDGTFLATSSLLPGFVAHGETEGAAIRKVKKALKVNLKEQERDFLRIIPREGRAEPFHSSRYRAPLYLRTPFSRSAKITLLAFCAGTVLGGSLLLLRTARR